MPLISTVAECDKPQENTIVINGVRELSMVNARACQMKEINCEEMRIYVEFPEPAENDEPLRKEIRDILIDALHKQLKEIS